MSSETIGQSGILLRIIHLARRRSTDEHKPIRNVLLFHHIIASTQSVDIIRGKVLALS